MIIYDGDFLNSFPSLSEPDFVHECYRAILLREGDPSGFSHYLARVSRGDDRLTLAAEFASSDEALALPLTRKAMAAKVLALRASEFARNASTPEEREALVTLIERYFTVISQSVPAGRASLATDTDTDTNDGDGEGDPFSTYLQSVIQAKGPNNVDIR